MNLKKVLCLLSCIVITAAGITGCGAQQTPGDPDVSGTSAAVSDSAETPSIAYVSGDELIVATGKYAGKTAAEITALLTLEEKAAQMSMAPSYSYNPSEMANIDYGAILTGGGGNLTQQGWMDSISDYQENALKSNAAIPLIYGFDSVHGVSLTQNAVIFPHNIAVGAANDPELTYQMGLAVADEMLLSGSYWNYSPCVAQATDPRWGRTYESYSTNLDIIKSLSLQYMKGNIDGGVLVCPKHFLADGNVVFGTGEGENLIDRGDAQISDAEIDELLEVYKQLIDNGAMSIMLSHSSLNGVKMHENKKYVDILKNDWGFQGFVAGDWDSVDNTSASDRKTQVVNCVNAGLDMLMQMSSFDESRKYIIEGVNEGLISQERVDDAVTRIIRTKIALGLFDGKEAQPKQTAVGSDEYRAIARQLVEKSQVLVKNEGDILPLKTGTKLYVTGPAADNAGAQNGGWTLSWTGTDNVPGTTTILDGLKAVAPEMGIELVSTREEADVVLLVIGEEPYAEWYGDTADMSITGAVALDGNLQAIAEAKNSEKPTVALIIAGRHVILSNYADYWDAIVMGYLPGTEGDGVANVLTGKVPFTGKLPMPWYSDVSQIGTDENWLDVGYGITT
ncbi:MAG: glycoside hydrolase family 3 C-terminal domain-containing protein [Ruminococcus sp.]|jgi:beta-glucosidase|nr:glycoside hydrolase family 3 C-terminal domain-containing protein [Ruminococcus sp.]